jgi:uncharacterized protein
MGQTTYLPESWVNPRTEVRASPINGKGLFATAPIQQGETIMIWGGYVFTLAELLDALKDGRASYEWSEGCIGEDLFLAGPRPAAESVDYHVNHSCDPNVWMADEVTVVARRAIQAGEEIVGDYALWESHPTYRLEPCHCGAEECRGAATGNDWQLPMLQEKYAGRFLPYLNVRIAKLQNTEYGNQN